MINSALWSDEYWVLIMQIYMRKPVGIKPMYSRQVVDLSLELHVSPECIYDRMFHLRRRDTPFIQYLWDVYSNNPKRLARAANQLRAMNGFHNADVFYDGVDTRETFECDFRPLGYPTPSTQTFGLTPVMLIMILDLYFRLTPITMVVETPEIIELARLIDISPETIVKVMDVFQFCDPYLNRDDMMISPLLVPCQKIWQRFDIESPEKLAALAAQLKDYFK